MSSVQRLASGLSDFNDGYSKTRIRVGKETDSFENVQASGSTMPFADHKANHFNIEHVDPITGMRFARTYFLSALNDNGDSQTLLMCYLSLIKASNQFSTKFMT